MYQHLDHLAAQSIAHERERDLHKDLRQREIERRRAPLERPVTPVANHWLRGALVRLHVLHAMSH